MGRGQRREESMRPRRAKSVVREYVEAFVFAKVGETSVGRTAASFVGKRGGSVMKPFRFGVNVWRATSRAEWVEKARKLEDLGYAVLSVPDHLADLFAPLPALVSAAEATTRLRVGTYVLNNDLRHPVLVARE